MKVLFKRNVLIPFHMADPAGIMFFGNIFALAHGTFEQWISEQEGGWSQWYTNPEWIAPIRKAEVDYFKPLRAGEVFEVSFTLKEVTDSSFVSLIEFIKAGECHARLETRQVFCDRKTIKKIPVPPQARKIFNELQ